LTVGSGGADVEFVAGEEMEEEGRAPGVEEVAFGVEAGMLEGKDAEALGVVAAEGVHELGVVFATGEGTEAFAVDAEQVVEALGFLFRGEGGAAEEHGVGMGRDGQEIARVGCVEGGLRGLGGRSDAGRGGLRGRQGRWRGRGGRR